MTRKLSLFWLVVLTVIGVNLLLQLGIHYLSMLIAHRSEPLPVPGALKVIYQALTFIGLLAYLAADEVHPGPQPEQP